MSGLKNLKTLCFVKKTKLLKNGEAPIFIRVTVGLDRGEFGVKKSVPPKYWDETKQRVKIGWPDAPEINTLLSNQEQRIRTIADYIAFESQAITPQAIIAKIQGKKEKRRTILEIFAEHNKKVQQFQVLILPKLLLGAMKLPICILRTLYDGSITRRIIL